MKRTLSFLFSVVLVMILLLGCNETKNLQDIFTSHHTNSDIIKVLKVNSGTVVLYASNNDYNIRAAEYSQVNKEWKMISDVSEDNAGKLSFGFTNKGYKNEVLFGTINDPNIKKVQVKKENGEILKATIVNKNERSYWYLVWTYGKAEIMGLSKDDQSIYKINLS